MQVIESRKDEMELQKLRKMEIVLNNAAIVFSERGIENTKMTDIAEISNIGVATIYRYFKTKAEIAIRVGLLFWEDVRINLLKRISCDSYINKTGYEQMVCLTQFYMDMYDNNKNLFKFIYYLDNYIIQERIDKERLKDYEDSIVAIKNVAMSSIKKGQEDGSIKKDINGEEIYIVSVHSLVTLCQKLIIENDILSIDDRISDKKQIDIFIEMILFYIKK